MTTEEFEQLADIAFAKSQTGRLKTWDKDDQKASMLLLMSQLEDGFFNSTDRCAISLMLISLDGETGKYYVTAVPVDFLLKTIGMGGILEWQSRLIEDGKGMGLQAIVMVDEGKHVKIPSDPQDEPTFQPGLLIVGRLAESEQQEMIVRLTNFEFAEDGTKRRQATATLEGDDLDNFAIGVFQQ